MACLAPSSSGLGRRPLKPETGVRLPLGLLSQRPNPHPAVGILIVTRFLPTGADFPFPGHHHLASGSSGIVWFSRQGLVQVMAREVRVQILRVVQRLRR